MLLCCDVIYVEQGDVIKKTFGYLVAKRGEKLMLIDEFIKATATYCYI
jgi:hypothetical protein